MKIANQRNVSLIRRRFYAYLIPGIIMVVAIQFGSLVDGIVIGNFIGEVGLSASSLALPVIYLCQAPGILLAIGSSIVVANLLGKRRIEDASRLFKAALMVGVGVSLAFVPIGLTLSTQIATLLGGDIASSIPELVPYLADYAKAYLVQAPIIAAALIFAYGLSSDNSPHLSAAFFIVANVVHIGLEILFCVTLPKEHIMFFAGIAMGIGMLSGFVVVIPYVRSKNRLLKFQRGFAGVLSSFRLAGGAGLAQGGTYLLLAVYSIFLNIAATNFLTDASTLAVYAMMQNFIFIIDLFVTGILQIVPNIVGVAYGERDFYSVKAIAKRAIILAFAVAVLLTLVSEIYPDMFFYIFNVDLQSAMQNIDARLVVRIYCLSFLVYAGNKFIVTYYPSILVNLPGVVSQAIKNGVLGIPLLYFWMASSGAFGFCYESVVTEVSAFALTIVFILIMKKANIYKGKGLLLLPEADMKEFVEFSFPRNPEEIGSFAKELQTYAQSMGLDEITSANVGIAGEEIINDILTHAQRKGKNHKGYIDVALSHVDDSVYLRVRDDGLAYDPIESEKPSDEPTFSGIEVIKKLAKSVSYSRVLNTNNTIIEIA